MENIVCKSCGGSVTRKGNYYICDFCRSKWMIDSGNDVHAVERANAWTALRDGDFEKAAELFEGIIVKDVNNHEGYWGRALALNGIIYVDDVREGKKVPTCNNITENSFLKDKDVQKAIEFAPEEIKTSYQVQAEQIEKIRIEWLEKASKEPPYDVFISFKDSDREHGIERTQDSIDAQDIYTGLVEAGYKVFYSRVSLRGKVSEQYEPYIYNAIKTAKVMIVFGEKPEYFSSTWIKNEWSRFRTRIEKGEKHKNSLVVVVKGMNPSDLPVALKSRQAMNMSDLTFFETLKKHIKRVVDESKQVVHLDKIEIKGGQIAKKAKTLEVNAVQTREIGAGATAQTDITELQTLSLADTYMKVGQWEDAAKLIDDVLFNNPSNVEALWKQILIEKHVVDNEEFSKEINRITQTDLKCVDKILNCATQDFATTILDVLYESRKFAIDGIYCQILKTILPYQYKKRSVQINYAFQWAIARSAKNSFDFLLSTIDANDVDKYIKYNLKYAIATKIDAEKKECLNRILKVDEGNIEALKMLLYIQLQDNEQSKTVIKTFESILKYSKDNRTEIRELLEWLGKNLNSLDDCVLAKQVLRYSNEDISTWKIELGNLSTKMIRLGFFEDAEYLCKLILTFDPLNPDVYWNICLIKTRAKVENQIAISNISLKGIPEYTKYLTLVDEKRRLECLKLVKKQEQEIIILKREKLEEERNIELARKRKKQKKIVTICLAVFLVVALVVVSIIFTVRNTDKKARGNCTFELKNGEYVVIGVENDALQTLIIPAKYKGKAVTTIADGAFRGCDSLKRVVIPDGVTSIGNEAFYDCDSLTSVVIPDSVTSIGGGAFRDCSSLTSVVIPDSVTSIGNEAFYDCESLTSISIPDSVTSIGNEAFSFCYRLTSISIPDSVTSIGDWAFKCCDRLTSISIPDSVTSIGSGAFRDCDRLTSISIPDSVTSIGNEAFRDCDSLTSISIPDSVTSIGNEAFYSCDSLTSVVIPDSVTSIGNEAFYSCESLTSVVIPDSVTSIGNEAFYSCESLTSITIPDSVTSIGNSAFSYCRSLTSISIPDSVTSIGNEAFRGCDSLTSISIPVTSIGSYAFYDCDSLTSVVIPDSVTSIGSHAFYDCSSLKSISIPDSVTSIGAGAFDDCDSLTSVYITDIAAWCNISFGSATANPWASAEYLTKYLYLNNELVTELVIPDTVTEIKPYAFSYCDRLTSVVIPDSVTSIGSYAFRGCSRLKSISIPDSVTSIGGGAFKYCGSLKGVVIPDSVTSIGSGAFEYCSLTIYCEATSKPSAWSSSWSGNCFVVWGYTGE